MHELQCRTVVRMAIYAHLVDEIRDGDARDGLTGSQPDLRLGRLGTACLPLTLALHVAWRDGAGRGHCRKMAWDYQRRGKRCDAGNAEKHEVTQSTVLLNYHGNEKADALAEITGGKSTPGSLVADT